MINALVVSKDRACQLRLLLESIKLNADNFFNQILIIYKGSNFLYEEGYRKLQAEKILPNLAWQAEQDFVSDFKNAINGCGSHFMCGIVDDCVFYKRLPVTWEDVESAIQDDVFPEQNMVACKQNVLFSIATNCVQDPPLVAGLMYPYTEEYLNNKYLNDEVISLEGLEYGFQNVSWCHTEMPFRFNKINSGE